MDLQNIPAIYPEGAATQQQAAQMQQAAAMAQAAQAQQIAGMTQAGAAAQAGMPVSHRPMRQAGRQLRSTTQLHAVVEACQTVRIACVDEEGPFIVPMSFGYDWADPEEIDADAPPGWHWGRRSRTSDRPRARPRALGRKARDGR